MTVAAVERLGQPDHTPSCTVASIDLRAFCAAVEEAPEAWRAFEQAFPEQGEMGGWG